jgi:phosphatidylethanolamine/phosphatidyl-N-methylethanolamine N-methyltransferase
MGESQLTDSCGWASIAFGCQSFYDLPNILWSRKRLIKERVMDIEAVKKAYRRYSPFYNYLFGRVFHEGRRLAVGIVNKNAAPHDKVLEVGVGTGLSLPFYRTDLEVTGVDISDEMLDKARQLCEKQNLFQVKQLLAMDVEALQFADHAFNHVVAMYVASVVPNLDKFIAEITRVCKPNGNIIIVNHFSSQNPILSLVEKKLSIAHKWFGFHANFPIEPLLNHPKLILHSQCKVNVLGYWRLLHFKNNA